MDNSFFVVMAISIVFLGVGLATARRLPIREAGMFSMLLIAFFSCCPLLSITLIIQSLTTLFGFVFLQLPRGGTAFCRATAALGFVAGWGYGTHTQWEKREAYNKLREDYPVESLEARIAAPMPFVPRDPNRYDTLDGNIITEAGRGAYFTRNAMLKELHEKQFTWFANSPGFGAVRMVRRGPVRTVIERNDDDKPVPQPVPPFQGIESTGDAVALDLYNPFHDGALFGFTAPQNWGYRLGGARAAGFRPHGFGDAPYPPKAHKLERVELVGLLKHPTPVVYVTANLPRMEELAGVPTREPDAFEAAAVAKIKAGDDLIATRIGTTVRLLGSIRTLESCLDCHTGNKGDLLGAFSYRLTMQP